MSLLFIIYVFGLFILSDHIEFGSYSDDTNRFVYGENSDQILSELEKHMTSTFE